MATRQLLAIAPILGSLILGSAHADPIQIDELARYPSVSSVSMSLEGDMLVGLVLDPTRDGKEQAAAKWDISGDIDVSKPLVPTYITPSNARMRFFGANALKQGKSLWFAKQTWTGRLAGCGEGKVTGATKTFVTKVYMADENLKIDDLPEGTMERLTESQEKCKEIQNTTGIASIMATDPENVIIRRNTFRDGLRYYKHSLKTGKEEFLYSDNGAVRIDLISGQTGMPISKAELDFNDGEYQVFHYLIDPATGEFTKEDPLTEIARERYQIDVLGQQEETGKYFVLTDKFSDKAAIYMYDPATDTFSDQPLFAHPDFSASGIEFSRRQKDYGAVLGFYYAGAELETYWLDPELKALQEALEGSFPDRTVSIDGYTDSLNRVLFSVSSSAYPPVYYLLVDKAKVALIGGQRPWIDTDNLKKTELVYYTARDGLKIPGLLTVPKDLKPGEKAKGAFILPHGGPWARDDAGWDGTGWPQFLATRGYVVLQPQYRGSSGWGRELWLAGDNEWGQKMQDDKDDGAAWLVSQGYVAADKIAIFGYSYGGFAAMAATVRENSPYQCAIAGAGVSNLARIKNNWSENRVQRAIQGHTLSGMDPMDNTEKANIPILVYHGDRDVRVPLFHGEDFYNAVKKYQPESKLVVVKDMPHSLPWSPAQHKETLTEIEKFLTGTCGLN